MRSFMDREFLKFDNALRVFSNRKGLFKNEGRKPRDRKTRVMALAKSRKERRDLMTNKGRQMDEDIGDFSDDDALRKPQNPAVEAREDRRKQLLEDFRKQKSKKKEISSKNKKPPFRAGAVHYPLSEFKAGNSTRT